MTSSASVRVVCCAATSGETPRVAFRPGAFARRRRGGTSRDRSLRVRDALRASLADGSILLSSPQRQSLTAFCALAPPRTPGKAHVWHRRARGSLLTLHFAPSSRRARGSHTSRLRQHIDHIKQNGAAAPTEATGDDADERLRLVAAPHNITVGFAAARRRERCNNQVRGRGRAAPDPTPIKEAPHSHCCR